MSSHMTSLSDTDMLLSHDLDEISNILAQTYHHKRLSQPENKEHLMIISWKVLCEISVIFDQWNQNDILLYRISAIYCFSTQSQASVSAIKIF